MRTQTLVDIQDVFPFRNVVLSEHERYHLEHLGFSQKLYRSDSLVKANKDDLFILVHSGWCCLYSNLPEGERQILDFPMKGDFLVLRHTDNGLGETLVTLTDLLIFQAPVSNILVSVANYPSLLSLVTAASLRHKSILIQHFNNIGRRKALVRVAHLLLELGTRSHMAGSGGVDKYACPLTQYDLADALGLTAIHVNRMLRELRERDLIDFKQKTVRIIDRPGLERLAGFDGKYLRLDQKEH